MRANTPDNAFWFPSSAFSILSDICQVSVKNLKTFRSIAARHFPRIVFRDGERLLWNPLRRQALALRPEERIRLQILEYLTLESGVSVSRIAVESPVPSRFSRGRTDILCHDSRFQPWLLIECKADHVRLGRRAATQSAVYNRFVKAPYLMLTNGLEDALFDVSGKPEPMEPDNFPEELTPRATEWYSDDPAYWSARGFLFTDLPDANASALARRLAQLYHLSGETRSWLDIPSPVHPLLPAHHHILLPARNRPDVLLAVCLRTVVDGQTVLTAVANQKKSNDVFFQCTLQPDGYFGDPQLVRRHNGNERLEKVLFDRLNDFWFPADSDHSTKCTPQQSTTAAGQLAMILEHILIGI